jgi:hypothetical protein
VYLTYFYIFFKKVKGGRVEGWKGGRVEGWKAFHPSTFDFFCVKKNKFVYPTYFYIFLKKIKGGRVEG